jgi:predicted ATP-grasp superfamily ATP-dependent carboligase
MVPRSAEDIYEEAEQKVECICGLRAVGYHGGWAVRHSDSCPVELAYREILIREALR